jgi:hypothetical protein
VLPTAARPAAAAHEVVEVDGFVFKRRRRTLLQPVENLTAADDHQQQQQQHASGSPVDGLVHAPAGKSPRATPRAAAGVLRTLAAAAASPGAPGALAAAAAEQEAGRQEPRAVQAAEVLAQAFRTNSLELSCLTMSTAQMELQHLAPGAQEQLQPVLQDVADRFVALLRCALRPSAGEVQQRGGGTPARPAASSRLYKALLRQDLAMLAARRAELASLRARYEAADGGAAEDGAAAAAAAAEGAEPAAAPTNANTMEVALLGREVHTRAALQVGRRRQCWPRPSSPPACLHPARTRWHKAADGRRRPARAGGRRGGAGEQGGGAGGRRGPGLQGAAGGARRRRGRLLPMQPQPVQLLPRP